MCPAPNTYVIQLSDAVYGKPLPWPQEIVTTDVAPM